jgi:arylsulfatase A-like enzyme
VTAGDLVVPMIFAGPGIPAARKIGQARIVDLAPTLIEMLNGEKAAAEHFDGVSLWPQLKNAQL